MTLQNVRLKIASPALKLKVQPRLPLTLQGANGISVTTANGVTTVGVANGGVIGNINGPGAVLGVAGQIAAFTTDGYNIAGVGVQASAFLTSAIEFTMDGAGSPVPTGFRGCIELPFACRITRATLMASGVGNLSMDVFKTTAAAPTGGASIVAATPPTLAGAQYAQDATLTGWSTALAAGDVLAYYVTGSPTVVQATLSLLVSRLVP
jgi:hypothetical protein